MFVELLALTELPRVAQLRLASHPDPRVRRALAAAPDTDSDVLDRLCVDRDPQTVLWALRRTVNVSRLSQVTSAGPTPRCAAALRNTLTPVESVLPYLDSSDRAAALAALCHPSVPEEQRRAALTPDLAAAVTQVGGSLGDAVVRAGELTLANRWMLEDPALWSPLIRRGLASLPGLSQEEFTRLLAATSPRAKSLRAHPRTVFAGSEDYPTSALVALGSAAAALEALERTDFDSAHGEALLAHPEPHVLARLARRFGPSILCAAPPLAQTRIRSAAWSYPLVSYTDALRGVVWSQVTAPVEALGADPAAWEVVLGLLPDWSGSWSDLVRAARAL